MLACLYNGGCRSSRLAHSAEKGEEKEEKTSPPQLEPNLISIVPPPATSIVWSEQRAAYQ